MEVIYVFLWVLWVDYVEGSEGQPSTLPAGNSVPSCSFVSVKGAQAGYLIEECGYSATTQRAVS